MIFYARKDCAGGIRRASLWSKKGSDIIQVSQPAYLPSFVGAAFARLSALVLDG
jgi:hypothetical protein